LKEKTLVQKLGEEAQVAVEELFLAELIPFRLIVQKVVASPYDSEHYTLHFYDGRIPTVVVLWQPNFRFPH
jgi:hypothetical protein